MTSDYTPRLQVEISEEHDKKLKKYFGEYGQKKLLIFVVLEDLFTLVEKYGAANVIGALSSRSITLKEVCRLKMEERDDNN